MANKLRNGVLSTGLDNFTKCNMKIMVGSRSNNNISVEATVLS